MVDNNFVDTIIQLPTDLFFGTNIGTCILVLKKNKADNNILFIDASKEFVRTTNKAKLSPNNIDNVINIVKERTTIEGKSILVPYDKIVSEDYNLFVSNYLKVKEEIEEIDIENLNSEIIEILNEQNKLNQQINNIINELENN